MITLRKRELHEVMTAEEITDMEAAESFGGPQERAQRGAEFLDRLMPGWDLTVDPSRLEMGSPCMCVLGQLFEPVSSQYNECHEALYDADGALMYSAGDVPGGYTLGLSVLGLADEDGYEDTAAIWLGFENGPAVGPEDFVNYHDLNDAWRALLRARAIARATTDSKETTRG